MTLVEIAEELVAGCREGRERANLEKLYHPQATSVEAADYTGAGRETVGLDAIRGKHDWWDGAFEVHDLDVQGPFLHGEDRFAVVFEINCTERETGERMPMKEVAIYHVADSRITREEFFGTG